MGKFEALGFYTHCDSVGSPQDFTLIVHSLPCQEDSYSDTMTMPTVYLTPMTWKYTQVVFSCLAGRHKVDINCHAHAFL